MKLKITLLIWLMFSTVGLISQQKIPTQQFETGTVTDYDNNSYTTVKIGNQWWMAENLRTKHYTDGTAIDAFAGTYTDFATNYTYVNNDANNTAAYGLLYSYCAFVNQAGTTQKNLLPDGWKVPSLSDWQTLSLYLGGVELAAGNFSAVAGGYSIAGGKLKSTTNWTSPNTDATNSSGFSAVPAGDCNSTSGYTAFGTEAHYWVPDLVGTASQGGRKYVILSNTTGDVIRNQFRNSNLLSLRLMKDVTTSDVSPETQGVLLHETVVSEKLQLSGLASKSTISVYSMNGLLMKTIATNAENSQSIDVSGFTSGMYVLIIKNESKQLIHKFIKK